jgi:hypothetical protein
LSALTFYGDESGAHEHEGAFVLSGYLGWDDAWEDLSEKWVHVLHNEGKRIEYFHMYECYKLKDQFEGWSRPHADKKMNALIDVLLPFIRSKKLIEFTVFLDWDIYNKTMKGTMKREVFNNPYFLLTHVLTHEIVTDLEQRGVAEPVWFWMDDQAAKLEYNIAQQFAYVKELRGAQGQLLHGLAFKDDRMSDPLQCADLIAWQRHRRDLNLPVDLGGRKEWKRLDRASAGSGKLITFREDGMQQFVADFHARIAELKAQGVDVSAFEPGVE